LCRETLGRRVVEPDSRLRCRDSWSAAVPNVLGSGAGGRWVGGRRIKVVAITQGRAGKGKERVRASIGGDLKVQWTRPRGEFDGHTLPPRLVDAIPILVVVVFLGNILVPITGPLPDDLNVALFLRSAGRLVVVVASQDARGVVEILGLPGLQTGGKELTITPALCVVFGRSGRGWFPLGNVARTKVGAGSYGENGGEEEAERGEDISFQHV